MTTTDLIAHLTEQLDWHWQHQLRPRFDGLTDAEYFWEPVPDCWTVRRDGDRMIADFAFPPPQPEPVTTIAWRLAHVIVGVLAVRAHSHFGGPPAAYETWDYAADAATALRQLGRRLRALGGRRRPPDFRRARATHRSNRGALGRPADARPDPAHQPRSHSPRRGNRTAQRPLRPHHHEGELTMPAMPGPVADERQALRDFIFQQQQAFTALAFGLTDDQARATPTVSALSIGALIKHVTGCQRSWMQRVAAAPEPPPADDRSMEDRQAEYADEFTMGPDETLASILDRFAAQNADTLRTAGGGRSGRAGARAAGCAVVSQGRRGMVGAMGDVPPDRGVGAARRARRHHSGDHRRRDHVRAAGRSGGLAGDRLAHTVRTGKLALVRLARHSCG